MIKRIGVVGGGQLGRMLGLAGLPLGLQFRFWDPSPQAPAGAIGEMFQADFYDISAAGKFADGLDAITYEFENVSTETLKQLQSLAPCRPGAFSLSTSQDRLVEKTFFQDNGVEIAPWRAIESEDELRLAFEEFGPCIVKTRTLGYDGKGQVRVAAASDCAAAWAELGSQPIIVEKQVAFSRELSLVAVRGVDGDLRTWPLVENEHRGGILHKTIAPAPGVSPALQEKADAILRATMEALDHVGVLTIEFFEVDGRLLANEMAPRVHNSGHWTIEGAVTSQFENHVRAVAGLPLGFTEPRFSSVMINCIGAMPPADKVVRLGGTHFHSYAKSSRPGRKMGHITVCDEMPGDSHAGDFVERVQAVEDLAISAAGQVAHV